MLQTCGNIETEQEAAWVCRDTGQKSQGQRKGNTDGRAGAETELHSQDPEDKYSLTGVMKV